MMINYVSNLGYVNCMIFGLWVRTINKIMMSQLYNINPEVGASAFDLSIKSKEGEEEGLFREFMICATEVPHSGRYGREKQIDRNQTHTSNEAKPINSQKWMKNEVSSPQLDLTINSQMRKLKSGFIYNARQVKNNFSTHSKSKMQNSIRKGEVRNEVIVQNSEDINQIYEMIQGLQQKLQRIQRRQKSKANSKTHILLDQTQLKPNEKKPNLKINPSILQINSLLDKNIKETSEQGEISKLKEEINRLKNVIRDMQIQKIKSNQQQGLLSESVLRRKLRNAIQMPKKTISLEQPSPIKEYKSFESPRQSKNPFQSFNRIQDAGKIIHFKNSSLQNSRTFTRNKHSLPKINRQNKNHSFMQSSQIIESGDFPAMSFQKGNKGNININSIKFDEFDNNPQLSMSMLQVNYRDIQIPKLPPPPHTSMNQQQLQKLAKSTYSIFDVKIDDDKNLMVKKYKNCVLFTINNQQHLSILWHFSGKFYMGGWRTSQVGEGEKDGQGLEITPGKHIYKGQFLNGKKSGMGIMKQQNGSIYDGQWTDSNKNGRGVYFDANTKAIYNGEWKDNKKDGQGFLKASQKEYYFGTFVRSIKEGFGEQTFVNGDKYKGEYKNGKFHGKGKYVWVNGSRYQGQFTEGARNGEGSWKSAKDNADIYIGSYKEDKKNGYGRYMWANGSIYQGQFVNDMKHGKGRITYADGSENKGVWKQGVLVNQKQKRAAEQEEKPLQRAVRNIPVNLMSPSKRTKS